MIDRLPVSGWPANDDLIDGWHVTNAEVHLALILRAESAAAVHLLYLHLLVPVQFDASADCAPVARTAFQLEINPMTSRLDGVAIHQQRSALVRDDHVECASVAEIGERHRPAIVDIVDADHLRHIRESTEAVIHPHPLSLVPGQASAVHGRPVLRVADDGAVSDGDLRKVVPVAGPLAGGD